MLSVVLSFLRKRRVATSGCPLAVITMHGYFLQRSVVAMHAVTDTTMGHPNTLATLQLIPQSVLTCRTCPLQFA